MLNFRSLAIQIASLNKDIRQERVGRAQQSVRALELLKELGPQWTHIRKRLERERHTVRWLAALPTESFDVASPLPPVPATYSVFATDGSQIDLERHQAVPCYVISIGRVSLTYGMKPNAVLDNDATMFYKDEDLYLGSGMGKQQVRGSFIAARRDAEEMHHAAELATATATVSPVVMMDGTLIRWTLESFEAPVQKSLLKKFLDALTACKEHTVPVMSYISSSQGKEIIDIIQIGQCAHGTITCSVCLAKQETNFTTLHDGEVMQLLLRTGERSALFESTSSILKQYGDHHIYFFYLNVGPEIVRIEIPAWVAEDKDLLNRVHAVSFDQATRGKGYPVALMEAHEQAVITAADREAFFALMDTELRGAGPIRITEKALSKKVRMI